MIEFVVNQRGNPAVVQREIPPTVYLDHWALHKISGNQTLADRLTAALKSQNGTLALSWLNVAEFTQVTDVEQARRAEELVEAILPQIFWIEVDPLAVISREDKLLAGGLPAPPHADTHSLLAHIGLKPTSLNLLTARDLFKVMLGRQDARNFDLVDEVINRIEAMRSELVTDPELRSAIRRSPSGPKIQRGTRFILRELVRALLIDRGTKLNRKYAIDLLHAVVSVAYCDLVLLDKYWKEQVDRARARLSAVGMSVPIARVFSGKANETDRFLAELESG